MLGEPVVDIVQLVQNSYQHQDPELRLRAGQMLEELKRDPNTFTHLAINAFLDERLVSQYRQIIGLQIKNRFTSKNPVTMSVLAKEWMSVENRLEIRQACLNLFGHADAAIRKVASQIIAMIGVHEYPNGAWRDVFEVLVDIGKKNKAHPELLMTVIETIGYLAEDLKIYGFEELSSFTSSLNLLSVGIIDYRRDRRVALVSSNALLNSIPFVRSVFSDPKLLKNILVLIFKAVDSEFPDVKINGLKCLSSACYLYYEYLDDYIADVYNYTKGGFASSNDDVQIAAISVFDKIADVELDIRDGIRKRVKYRGYIEKVAGDLVGLIFDILSKDPIDLSSLEVDEDTNYVSAWKLMNSIADIMNGQIYSITMGFISENITSSDPRMVSVSIIFFISPLEFVPTADAQEIIIKYLPILYEYARSSEVPKIRKLSIYAIDSILKSHFEAVEGSAVEILQLMLDLLEEDNIISVEAANCIGDLAKVIGGSSDGSTFLSVADRLVSRVQRQGSEAYDLAETIYRVLRKLIKRSSDQVIDVVKEIGKIGMGMLRTVLSEKGSSELNEMEISLFRMNLEFLKRIRGHDNDADAELWFELFLAMYSRAITPEMAVKGVNFLISSLKNPNLLGDLVYKIFEFLGQIILKVRDEGIVSEAVRALVTFYGKLQPYMEREMQERVILNILTVLRVDDFTVGSRRAALESLAELIASHEDAYELLRGEVLAIISKTIEEDVKHIRSTDMSSELEVFRNARSGLRDSVLYLYRVVCQRMGKMVNGEFILEYIAEITKLEKDREELKEGLIPWILDDATKVPEYARLIRGTEFLRDILKNLADNIDFESEEEKVIVDLYENLLKFEK